MERIRTLSQHCVECKSQNNYSEKDCKFAKDASLFIPEKGNDPWKETLQMSRHFHCTDRAEPIKINYSE